MVFLQWNPWFSGPAYEGGSCSLRWRYRVELIPIFRVWSIRKGISQVQTCLFRKPCSKNLFLSKNLTKNSQYEGDFEKNRAKNSSWKRVLWNAENSNKAKCFGITPILIRIFGHKCHNQGTPRHVSLLKKNIETASLGPSSLGIFSKMFAVLWAYSRFTGPIFEEKNWLSIFQTTFYWILLNILYEISENISKAARSVPPTLFWHGMTLTQKINSIEMFKHPLCYAFYLLWVL